MAQTLSTKDRKILLDGLEEQGCRVEAAKVGYRIYTPAGGKILTLHLTLSDGRGMKNLRSEALREGLKWPLDGGK